MRYRFAYLGKFVDVKHQTRLDVRGLVLVDGVVLGQFVEHLLYFGKHLGGLGLLSRCTQLAHSVTHGLCVVSVVQTTSSRLTNAFNSGFVVCHFRILFY